MPQDFDPRIGQADMLEPGLSRIVAPNPSPMTFRGTNTYLLGETDIAVIDPGPVSEPHLAAILAALTPKQRITHIIVSHAHLDHSPLARILKARCDANIYAFGTAEDGRSDIMKVLAQSGLTGGGEGVDLNFVPDVRVADGEILSGADWDLEVLHTPGHIGNHISLAWGDNCFTADHVMGWSTSLISPPDGDLTDFMASCGRLARRTWQRFYPGHGDIISEPNARVEWLIAHRQNREAAILARLQSIPANADLLARDIYTDIPEHLLAAATRNVLAHLVDLTQKNVIKPDRELCAEAIFELK